MALDFTVLCLLCIAVVAGFEKGLFRSFSLLLACFFSIIVSLILAPALMDFLEHSFGQFKIGYQFVATMCVFLFLTLVFFHLLQVISQQESSNYLRRSFGSMLLATMMLFSIGILSGFMIESGLISQEKITDSYSYRVIRPMQDMTSKVWEEAIAGADAIKDRSNKHRQASLSRIN